MKRWGQQKPIRFDGSELKTDLGRGNFVFVGSSCDMFAKNIPHDWIHNTLDLCHQFENRYLFQSKNPKRFLDYEYVMVNNSVLCATIETNRVYKEMGDTPTPEERTHGMGVLSGDKFITIEPIMDFDLKDFVELIKATGAGQVNIGCDSGNNNLPEPPKEKVLELISELEKFTTIHSKKNLKRLLI
jgi:hypothetical protein